MAIERTLRLGAWVLGCLAFLSVAGCTADAEIPTEADVASTLEMAFANATSSDPDTLCEVAATQGNCRALMESAGNAPTAAPQLACTAEYLGDDTHPAGRLVRIQGQSDSGEGYWMDTLALADGDKTRLMNPVYWVPSQVSDGESTDEVIEFDC